MLDFSIGWPGGVTKALPDVAYRFFLVTAEVSVPFKRKYVGDHLRLDYRLVTDAGEVASDQWYGSASSGGLAGIIGINGNYKSIVGTLEYSYTRFFYSFADARARQQAGQSAGALDQYHAIMLSAAYSY